MEDGSVLRDRQEMSTSAEQAVASDSDDLGYIHLLTAGFPCQPFSQASHGQRTADDLWPDTLRIIRLVRPVWVVLENVPGDWSEHIDRACSDLEGIGYAVWPMDIAVEVRNHVRRRCWVVAHTNGDCEPQRPLHDQVASIQEAARRWRDQPEPMGMDDGLPARLDRNRMTMLGNAIEPAIAEMIFRSISGDVQYK